MILNKNLLNFTSGHRFDGNGKMLDKFNRDKKVFCFPSSNIFSSYLKK